MTSYDKARLYEALGKVWEAHESFQAAGTDYDFMEFVAAAMSDSFKKAYEHAEWAKRRAGVAP